MWETLWMTSDMTAVNSKTKLETICSGEGEAAKDAKSEGTDDAKDRGTPAEQ